jgi:hypothetical protein
VAGSGHHPLERGEPLFLPPLGLPEHRESERLGEVALRPECVPERLHRPDDLDQLDRAPEPQIARHLVELVEVVAAAVRVLDIRHVLEELGLGRAAAHLKLDLEMPLLPDPVPLRDRGVVLLALRVDLHVEPPGPQVVQQLVEGGLDAPEVALSAGLLALVVIAGVVFPVLPDRHVGVVEVDVASAGEGDLALLGRT